MTSMIWLAFDIPNIHYQYSAIATDLKQSPKYPAKHYSNDQYVKIAEN